MTGLWSYLSALSIAAGTWLWLMRKTGAKPTSAPLIGSLHDQTRSGWHPGQITTLLPAAGIFAGTLGLALGSVKLALAFSVLGVWTPLLAASAARRRRNRLISRGVAPALEQLAKVYLVQPHPYAAIRAAAASIPEPLRTEFSQVIARCEANMPLPEALWEMADRLGNLYLHQLVQVVDVSLKTGLNLQEALDTMVDEIRSAQELQAEREAATSAFYIVTYLFTGLELLLVGNLLLRYPEHVSALWQSPMGQMITVYVTVTTVVALLLPRLLAFGHDLAG